MPDTLSRRRADELAVDILQACADRQAMLRLIHRYGDARVAAYIDTLTAAATKTRDRLAWWLWSEDDSGDDNELVAAYDELRDLLGPSTEEGVAATLAGESHECRKHGPDGNEGYCRCGTFVGHGGNWEDHRDDTGA